MQGTLLQSTLFSKLMIFRRLSLAVYPAAVYAAIIPAIFIMSEAEGMKGCLGYDCLGSGTICRSKECTCGPGYVCSIQKAVFPASMLWYLGALPQKETASSMGIVLVLIQTLDTVRRQPWRKVLTADIDSLHEQTNRLLKRRCSKSSFGILILISIQWESGSPIKTAKHGFQYEVSACR